ncbi:angiogenic factor with G patch and FHA domains 1-like isoform X2 [Amphibalanus amphitrite]|uniref:angiogenic factor with G patch and FHA domains 1-like isoform X2 n=1 Tax=Amphibalanus amphitrite TaxID=1232801 RepID=UPI001C91B057|nr:angiogenic factor with G patch and FHA domains 1-like isoform X2 [Amphibalanus amphitrite]
MDWLSLRLSNMRLEERVKREKNNTRRLGKLVTSDVMETDGDVIDGEGDVMSASGDVIRQNVDASSGEEARCCAGDALEVSEKEGSDGIEIPVNSDKNEVMDVIDNSSNGGDVISSIATADSKPDDVTEAVADDVSTLENASVMSVRASPVPADVTIAPDDVTLGLDDVTDTVVANSDVTLSDVTSSDDDETPEQLRERCRRQKRQLRGLKRRLEQLQRENAALRMRRDPEEVVAEGVKEDTALDPAAIVEDIKQAAAETAAQLAPSGLVFEPETGLYYDHDSGYYWDASAQMYYDGTNGYYLRYDEVSASYVYVEPAANASATPVDPSKQPSSPKDPSEEPSAAPRRKRSSGEELEEGEIEEEEEEGERVEYHWTGEEYWTERRERWRERERREEVTKVEQRTQYQARETSTPAVIESGPRSPIPTVTEPPWLRMIVTETKLADLRVGSLHIATIDGLTVGRDTSQQLCLNDTNLSKFHAVIGYRAESADTVGGASGGYYIRDLGSRNGTFVDDKRISVAKQESEDTALPHGCVLRLGGTCLMCHVHVANDTCLECEPGQTQQKLPSTLIPPAAAVGDARLQRRQVAKRIKQKYGLRAGDGAVVELAPGYSDRAAERRQTKGSAHHSEKTQTADIRQKLPEKNKGFQLLQKMGWKEGSGLGREGQGRVEPVLAEERAERRGLGCEEVVAPVVGKKQQRKTEVWQKTQERFSKLV